MTSMMNNSITVLVFGTFDGLHEGHLDFFRQAKARGTRLVVVVARDTTVEEVKGHTPTEGELRRLEEVKKSDFVDQALLGHRGDKYRIVEEVRPDIIALGYDQNAFVSSLEEELVKRNLKAKIVRLEPYHPEKYKSSLLKKLPTL